MRYGHKNLFKILQEAIRSQGDTIASAIWEQFNMFEDSVKTFFQDQIESMAPLATGFKGSEAPVHQLHISKNSYIKPHIEKSDLEAFLITWFTKGFLFSFLATFYFVGFWFILFENSKIFIFENNYLFYDEIWYRLRYLDLQEKHIELMFNVSIKNYRQNFWWDNSVINIMFVCIC